MRGGMRFVPTQGSGGSLKAGMEGTCSDDSYQPSLLEQGFAEHAVEWTRNPVVLCEHLGGRRQWLRENAGGATASGLRIFSRLCRKGQPPQLLEPLAGILRDPTFLCDSTDTRALFSIDWLVLADRTAVPAPSSKKILFDAGGTRFMDAMQFFTSKYESRGISLDKIYVWEAVPQGTEAYWEGVPAAVRSKWEPRLTFYDGVPCSAEPDHEDNPVRRILAECRPEDFCAFKLDIDTPSVELPIVMQLLASPKIGKVLDEFFFEHHVHGLMQQYGWGSEVNGTVADSYSIFSQLRRMGVRAHSWI